MTRDDDFIGQLEGYLDEYEGQTPLPDAVRNAIRAQLPSNRQIGPIAGLMRDPNMNTKTSAPVRYGLVAAVAVAAVVLGAALVSRSPFVGDQDPSPYPSRIVIEPSLTPSPEATTAMLCPPAGPGATPSEPPLEWSGPVRSNGHEMLVHELVQDPRTGSFSSQECRDAAPGWVDITRLSVVPEGQIHWYIELADTPPPTADLDPAKTTISYGLVLETTGDGVPDYVVGLSTDAPRQGDWRVWVTDLATGIIDERTEGPYGYPVEFGLTGGDSPTEEPTVIFTFLGGSRPPGVDATTWFYAWASLTQAGEVVAWDYAPDTNWLVAAPTPEP